MATSPIRPASDELRSRVIRAARALFAEKGYVGTRTRDIAKRAGTSESGIYRALPEGDSKYDLLVAVLDDSWRHINEEIENSGALAMPDPVDSVCEIIKVFWDLCSRNPQLGRFLVLNTVAADAFFALPTNKKRRSEQSYKFFQLIEERCSKCAKDPYPSGRVLCEAVFGIAEGVLAGWCLADLPEYDYPAKISQQDAVRFIRDALQGAIKHVSADQRRVPTGTRQSRRADRTR